MVAEAGWSFEEALQRTSDPLTWDRYQAERRQQSPTSTDLRRGLVQNLVAKIGTQLVAATDEQASGDDRWSILDRSALEKKIADNELDQVRLFPPLRAPNAIEQLRGRNLGEAVYRHIVGDSEVTVLMERRGTQDRFEEGRCPLWMSGYHWPLDATTSGFAFRLTEGGLLIMERLGQRSTPEILALSAALVDRIEALRGLLVSAKVQAFGFTAQFVELLVPPRLWTRKSLSIDITNGDLCAEDDRGSFSTLWASIELRCPISEVSAPQLPTGQVAGRTRRPKGQEVERIIREYQIDVDSLGPKNAAAAVAKYMTHPPRVCERPEGPGKTGGLSCS